MRLDQPRVPPLPESEWNEQARQTIEPTRAMSGGTTAMPRNRSGARAIASSM